MAERKPLEGDLARGERRDEIVVGDRVGDAVRRDPVVAIGREHDALDAGHRRNDLPRLTEIVEPFAVVEITVCQDQYLGLDLAEPVEHALDAEIGRA